MSKKQILKMSVDVGMTLLLLFLMGYQLWGEAAHEWAGMCIFTLFIFHHFLNRGWYKSLFKGKYNGMRILMIVTNLLLLGEMFSLMFSAVVLSRYVFSAFPVHGMVWIARKMHMAGAYWSLVLMAFHLGLHWNMILTMFTKRKERAENKSQKIRFVPVVLAGLVAVYGLRAFIKRNLFTYLFLQTEFVFLDYNESKLLFYLDYLAIMGLFIFIAHYGSRLMLKINRR